MDLAEKEDAKMVQRACLETPQQILIALQDLGVREIKGDEDHPRIVEAHRTTTLPPRAHTDEVPWCSSIVNLWMLEAGHPGTNNALARSWLSWGSESPEPALGDVCVLKRRKRGSDRRTGSRTGYHVGLFLNYSRGHIVLISGNTDNRVGIDTFHKGRWATVGVRRG